MKLLKRMIAFILSAPLPIFLICACGAAPNPAPNPRPDHGSIIEPEPAPFSKK